MEHATSDNYQPYFYFQGKKPAANDVRTLEPFSKVPCNRRCRGWWSIPHPVDAVLLNCGFFGTDSHSWLPHSERYVWEYRVHTWDRHLAGSGRIH